MVLGISPVRNKTFPDISEICIQLEMSAFCFKKLPSLGYADESAFRSVVLFRKAVFVTEYGRVGIDRNRVYSIEHIR